jgi:Na+-driven multidrug efflux pump
MLSPLVPIQIQGAGFFQAIKKPIHAMLLSLTRQAIFLAPLLLTLPKRFGAEGMFYGGPAADLLSVAVTLPMLLHYMKKLRAAQDGTALIL